MLTPEIIVTDPGMKAAYWPMPFDYYCLGWRYGNRHPDPILWHTGGTLGHTTIVAFEPESRLGILIFTNSRNPITQILATKFMDMYFANPDVDYLDQVMQGNAAAGSSGNDSQTAPQAQPSAPLPYESYAGSYADEVFGNLNVFVDDGRLAMALGPRNTEIILKPCNRDVFLISCTDFPELDGGLAAFQIGPEGRAEGLTTETGGLLDGSFKKI
jgi:CubicO group peptidase (beta-lactamase class C family)